MLPHIDPLLTIKNEYNQMYSQNYQPSIEPASYNQPKWEPIITKVYPDYSYGYGDMVETNRLSMMNTDIFWSFLHLIHIFVSTLFMEQFVGRFVTDAPVSLHGCFLLLWISYIIYSYYSVLQLNLQIFQ